MKKSMIVCCDIRGGIAKEKKIPWLNEKFSKTDLKRFKELTMNTYIVMGRNTYNEIAGLRAIITDILPDRKSFVITSNPDQVCPGATTISSLDDIPDDKDIFIIGGVQLYETELLNCDSVYISFINQDYDCDQFFPGHLLEHTYNVEYIPTEHNNLIFANYTKI